MGASNNNQGNINFFKLRAKTSDTDPSPFFGKSEKVNDKWEVTERFNTMSGHLVGISHDKYEYEGETKFKAILKFRDADGTINQVEAGFNNLTYSVLNSLLSVEPRFVTIQVWLGNARVDNGKAGKRYPNASVYNSETEQLDAQGRPHPDNKIGWAMSFDETPKAEKVTVGKKTVTDDSNVVEFWKEKIEDIAKTLKSEPKPELTPYGKPVTPNKEADTEQPKHFVADDDDNSLPF